MWSALIVDDDPGVRQSIRLCLEADSARALGVGTSTGALEALERGRFDVVFLDLWLGKESGLSLLPEILRLQPGIGVIVITAFATFETAVEAMKLGAVDYLPKPFTPDQVRHAARRVVTESQLKRKIGELQQRIDETEGETSFETNSPVFRAFLLTAGRAAASDTVVLLRGESGTGKNVMARWIQARSKLADRPFVTVHCPMLSGDLMTSALFGHRKGSFTGAVSDTVGKVEEAEGGTLFLDEVGDLTPDAQARLLRFLNDQTYERLGESNERRANVRIVAATNRPLEDAVKEGRFREDLFYRLNVITLTIPPLRDRPEDIVLLARHCLRFLGRKQGRPDLSFSPAAEQAMEAYPWPGNLRELRNAVERAVILVPSKVLDPGDLGITPAAANSHASASSLLGSDVSLEVVEREHIARVVARAPSLEAAAKTLGIDATTLQRKRKRYGLS
ncbi:MAG: sigma-54-dependent Fis family transcriptional regulator [Planctomycetaceae bacterium]|nr:sigma-54-dependent Fis family transcriptional regulator [Planctomycetaceae bacterium]